MAEWRSLPCSFDQFRFRVNAIAPSGTLIKIQVVSAEGAAGSKVLGGYMSDVGRMTQTEEVTAVRGFLASDAASDIDGAILPLDGGWSAV